MTQRTRRRALLTLPLGLLALLAFAVAGGWAEDVLVLRVAPLRLEPMPSQSQAAAQAPERPAPTRSTGEAKPTLPPVVLAAPAPAPEGHGAAFAEPALAAGAPKAIAYEYMAPVYDRPSASGLVIGRVRRGVALPSPIPVGGTCGAGAWYRVDGGYVCTAMGFHVHAKELPAIDQKLPAIGRNLPYDYAEVISPRAPRFYRIPTLEELGAVEHAEALGEPLPRLEVVERYLDGAYFVAVDRREDTPIGPFVRTVRGRWLREADLRPASPSALRGEILEAGDLPLAFVPGAATVPVYRLEAEGAREVGHAEPYARVRVVERKHLDGVEYLLTDAGLALRRDQVRVADAVVAPDGLPPGDRWIHVDLDEQVLVAYEGAEPRYATLIASGKPGWDTPPGLHRIVSKLSTITMSGDDPREGYYEVEDVPWTMYYADSYALHGAYWHDAFGAVRSHGCTNLAPADARWLFGFTTPEVPAGWQARLLSRGSWVYLTRASGG